MPSDRQKNRERLRRQFEAIAAKLPVTGRTMRAFLAPSYVWIRLPLALLLIAGGVFGFLPVLGIWMLPLGLLLLAIDVPLIRPLIVNWVILGRRWITTRLRAWRRRKTPARRD